MLLTATVLGIALWQQATAGPVAKKTDDKPAAPPVDRSGEPVLKALFADSGSLRGVHIAIQNYYYENDADRYEPDSSSNLWIGNGGRFRLQSSSDTWGGGSLFVSDGEALMSDDMSDDGAIRISKPKKSLHEVNETELILYALEGQAGLEALIDKDQPLKVLKSEGGDQQIEIHAKKLGGKLVLHYRSGSPIPIEIDNYQIPWWQDDQTVAPAKPTSCEKLQIVTTGPIDSQLFKVAAPKGKKVTDERGKA